MMHNKKKRLNVVDSESNGKWHTLQTKFCESSKTWTVSLKSHFPSDCTWLVPWMSAMRHSYTLQVVEEAGSIL